MGPLGDVVGTYSASGVSHGFIYSQGKYTTIDPPGATGVTATSINAAGEIALIGNLNGSAHAFLYSKGDFTMIDVPGSNYTNFTALPPRGGILGRYMTASGLAPGYYLRDGIFTTIQVPGSVMTGPAGMNERGDIVGRYQNSDNVFHSFLLTGLQPACPATMPRIANTSSGLAITHADFKIVSAQNPAVPGEVLSIFATGLGSTSTVVDAGKPFPSSPVSTVTSTPEVRMNGKVAEVIAAFGLPGTVGGYQVNFRVPADAAAGNLSLQLTSGMATDISGKVLVQR
jgi:uncharacterized protein (TIGR03437 family)